MISYEYRAAWRYGNDAPMKYGDHRRFYNEARRDVPDGCTYWWIEVRGVGPWSKT